jgi:Flp pilus assembly protein TadG
MTDRGAVSVMMAIFMVAILACLSLVVTGGRQLTALTEAREIASNAARAGAQGVDPDSLRDGADPRIDRAEAQRRIDAYYDTLVSIGGAEGVTVEWIDSVGPDADQTVTVRATVTPRPFLAVPGFEPRTVEAIESAVPLGGVTAPIDP